MLKTARKPSIVSSDLPSNPTEIDVFVNINLDVTLRIGEEYITVRPHDASQLSKMLKKCSVEAARKIEKECWR